MQKRYGAVNRRPSKGPACYGGRAHKVQARSTNQAVEEVVVVVRNGVLMAILSSTTRTGWLTTTSTALWGMTRGGRVVPRRSTLLEPVALDVAANHVAATQGRLQLCPASLGETACGTQSATSRTSLNGGRVRVYPFQAADLRRGQSVCFITKRWCAEGRGLEPPLTAWDSPTEVEDLGVDVEGGGRMTSDDFQ